MLKSLLFCRPGSLKRGLASQCPDDCSNKRSRTSSMSSLNNTYTSGIPSSLRNAIASSYSSSRGLTQVGSTPEGTTAAVHSTQQLDPLGPPRDSNPTAAVGREGVTGVTRSREKEGDKNNPFHALPPFQLESAWITAVCSCSEPRPLGSCRAVVKQCLNGQACGCDGGTSSWLAELCCL